MSNVIDFPAKEEEDPEMEWFFTVEVYKKPSGKYEYQLQVDELIIEPIDESETDEI